MAQKVHSGSVPVVPAIGGNVGGTGVMLRNVAFLLGGNLAGWVVGLLFWLFVPRIIGPAAWGEFSLGWALAGLAFAVGGFGITTFLVKEIARDRTRAVELLGTSLATHFVLSVLIVAGVFLFTILANYSPHTREVVLLVTGIAVCTFMVAPAVSTLQALEKMHLNSVVAGLRQVIATCTAVLLALVLRPDIIVLIVVVLAFNVMASFLQIAITNRDVVVRLRFDGALSRRLIVSSLPFWSNGVLLTIYVWIDSVLLSILVSTQEVGHYAAPAQVIATIGFLPAIITTVVFPALASSFHTDLERVRRLTRVSLSILISLGLPISVGAALVGPNAIQAIFGPAYRGSGPAMVVLALTVVPSYVATLTYWVLAAADRQRTWAYVMGVMAIVNPAINLVTIPFFQSRFGHGSEGAAVALLITDTAVCVAGLALLPRQFLRPVGPLLAVTARVAIATFVMAIPVGFLRDRFLLLPVLVGAGVFSVTAFVLGLFKSEGFDEAWVSFRGRVQRKYWPRSEIRVLAGTPPRYLRVALAVARSARQSEYAVVHFGSGSFLRTDRMGALAARALIGGRSDVEAMELVERIESGAGERARRLIDVLDSKGATTREPRLHAGRRRLRRVVAQGIGVTLTFLGPLVRVAPTGVLAWVFKSWPSTPFARHAWRSSRLTVLNNLRASGYDNRSEPWLIRVGRPCASEPSQAYLFNYLGVAIPPGRLDRLVDGVFDRDSVDALADNLRAAGPTVGAFLHGPLCVAVPNALRIRGVDVVRAVAAHSHGIYVSERAGQLSDFFGDAPDMTVDVTGPLATGALVRHLNRGRSLHVALDRVAGEGKTARIEMLGHCFARNDGPAWLAVRSGRPVALWTTHNSSSGVVIKASPLLHPDPTLPVEARVAALSERLYRYAEAAIRAHPEAWWCWSYLHHVQGGQS